MPTGIKINAGIPNKGYGRPTACDVSSSEHAVTFENVENVEKQSTTLAKHDSIY